MEAIWQCRSRMTERAAFAVSRNPVRFDRAGLLCVLCTHCGVAVSLSCVQEACRLFGHVTILAIPLQQAWMPSTKK